MTYLGFLLNVKWNSTLIFFSILIPYLRDVSGEVERIEISNQGFARQMFYSSNHISMGCAGIVCEKEGWVPNNVC